MATVCKKLQTDVLYKYTLLTLVSIVIMTIMVMGNDHFDPYSVLGLNRDASDKEIRSAYKVLARKWHPDKNKSPKAQDMFLRITESYNILSDKERRYKYDTFGTTKEDPRGSHDRGFHDGFGFHSFHGFHSFFGGTGNQNIPILTDRIYEKDVLPMSYKLPQLIYVYGDWCFQCMQLEMIWESSANELKSLGVGVYELNFQYSRNLNSRLNINFYPQFIALVEGRTVKYSANEFSNENLRKFVKSILPRGLVTEINSDSYLDFFRASFITNKPQAILYSNKLEVPLLFSILAFQYHQKMEFAYVNSNSVHTEKLRKRYGVHQGEQVFFIMKEEPSSPEVILKDSSLNQRAIRQAITSNLYFHLPRLSSPDVFNNVCPVSTDDNPRYCVLLFTISSQDHSYHRFILRRIAKEDYWRQNGVNFMYISEDVQKGFKFINSISNPLCKNDEYALKLLVFVRQSAEKIRYDLVDGGWCVDEPEEAAEKLKQYLNMLLEKEKLLVKEANISYIYDEHQPHFFLRIANYVGALAEHVASSYQFFSWNSPVSLIINSVMLGVIFLVGILLPLAGRSQPNQDEDIDHTVLGIIKLTPRIFAEQIKNPQPGRFLVVVLLDVENLSQVGSSPIMQAFSDATYSFVRGGLISFAWISLQEQLSWCAEIMDVKQFGNVLPGTVLALNIRKKYIHIFKPTGNVNSERLADFIGLESDYEADDDDIDTQPHKNQRLAARSIRVMLPTWLERLCDGTLIDRFRIENWPKLEQ